MKDKVEVEFGMKLIELADRAADNKDEESLKLIGDIGQELIMTTDIDVVGHADPITIVEYADMLAKAIREGDSVEPIKNSRIRTILND